MNDEEFKSILEKLKPVIGDMADAYWLAALLEPERKNDIHAVAQALASELLDEDYSGKHILLEPPPREKAKGEYPLGIVMYADKPHGLFGLRERDLMTHICILGRTGSGKTNIGSLIVWNLVKASKPFIVMDWRANYSHFPDRPEGKDILLFTLGEEGSLYFNPLSPPRQLTRNQRQAYLRDIVSVILGAYLPGNHLLSTRGVEYFMLSAIEDLEEEHGRPATLDEIRYYVDDYRAVGFEKDWKATSRNVLYKLTTGPIGRLFNCFDGTSIEDILDRQVILGLDALGSRTDRTCLSQAFLLWLYYHRLTEGKTAASKHVLLVEEAHNLFHKGQNGEQPLNDYLMRQMRDLGQSMVLLDQNPSLMSVPSLGNTGSLFVLSLRHGDDVEAAGKALTLPREQWEYIGKLSTGQAVVKVQDRWQKPFLVRFPLFPVSRVEKAPGTERAPFRSYSARAAIAEPRSAIDEAFLAVRRSDRREKDDRRIGPRERIMLIDIAENPLSILTERFRRLSLTAYSGAKTKRKLLEMGLIEQENLRIPTGMVALLKATEKGRELLSSWGIHLKALPHNGSLQHEYYKEMVARDYEAKGYKVEKEYPLGGGKAVDLVATKGDERIAIEIETGKSDVKENVRKCRDLYFDTIVSISTINGK